MRSRTRSSSGPGIAAASSSRASSGARPPSASCGSPANRLLVGRLAHREDETDGLRPESASHEPEGLHRRAIEPLRVVDHAEHRTLCCSLGQEAEHGQPQHEALRRAAVPQTEGRAERVALRSREAVQTVQQRRAQLVQPREGELGVRLHAGRTDHPVAGTSASTRYSSSADLPIPASPRITSDWLIPLCTLSRSWSSCPHSVRRSTSMG